MYEINCTKEESNSVNFDLINTSNKILNKGYFIFNYYTTLTSGGFKMSFWQYISFTVSVLIHHWLLKIPLWVILIKVNPEQRIKCILVLYRYLCRTISSRKYYHLSSQYFETDMIYLRMYVYTFWNYIGFYSLRHSWP